MITKSNFKDLLISLGFQRKKTYIQNFSVSLTTRFLLILINLN